MVTATKPSGAGSGPRNAAAPARRSGRRQDQPADRGSHPRPDRRPDWTAEVDDQLRTEVVALLKTHHIRHWHRLMTVLHPAAVMFARAALRRGLGHRTRLTFQQPGRGAVTQLDEQALDVALMVCGDLRKNGYRRLALFQGLAAESGAPLRGYIAKITRQTAFRYLRTQVLRPDGGRREVTSEAQAAGPATLERMAAASGFDTRSRVARDIVRREGELELLSDRQRAFLELYLSGYSVAEIAELHGPPIDAAAAHQIIRSAKAKLKYHFGRKGQP